MATRYFDLSTLFQQAFGYGSPAFEPEFKPTRGSTSPGRNATGAFGTAYYGVDNLNREYYLPVTLSFNDNGRNTAYELPHPVVSISSRKSIIETPMTERGGTVKELINMENYTILIKGFLINDSNELPEEQVTRLRKLYELREAVSIRCALTDVFLVRPDRSGSDKVIVKELKMPALPGVKQVRPYELTLVSDDPINLLTVN